MAIESPKDAGAAVIADDQQPTQAEQLQHDRLADDYDDDANRRSAGDACQRVRPKRQATFLHEHTFLKRDPATTTCPNCLCAVTTLVERRNAPATHLSALMLLPVCLCALPYWSKVLRDTIHRCPSCGVHLGAKFASARDAFLVCLGSQPSGEPDNKDLVVTANSDLQFF